MSEHQEDHGREPVPLVPATDPEAWKTVYMGQLSHDLVPFHPEPPEAPEDELTREAMEDPGDVTRADADGERAPTLWRLVVVVLVAVGALAIVFWHR